MNLANTKPFVPIWISN